MKVVYEKLSGWINACRNQETVQLYHKIFKQQGTIKFLGADSNGDQIFMDYLVDVSQSGQAIVVNYYPYTNPDLIPSDKMDPETRAQMDNIVINFYKAMEEKYKGVRKSFTLNLFNMKELTIVDFNSYSVPDNANIKILGFVVEWMEEGEFKSDFPKFYAIERRDTQEMKTLFPVFPLASRTLFSSQGEGTVFGKYLSFLLLRSHQLDKFVGLAPNLTSANIPTSNMTEIPKYLKVEALLEFLDEKQVDKLTKGVNGMQDRSTPQEEYTSTSTEESRIVEIKSRMSRQFLDKNELNVSDVLEVGPREVLAMFKGGDKKPISIYMDMGFIAQKMCIFEGFFYAVPLEDREAQELLMAEFDNYVVPCLPEAFPTIGAKLLPAASSTLH